MARAAAFRWDLASPDEPRRVYAHHYIAWAVLAANSTIFINQLITGHVGCQTNALFPFWFWCSVCGVCFLRLLLSYCSLWFSLAVSPILSVSPTPSRALVFIVSLLASRARVIDMPVYRYIYIYTNYTDVQTLTTFAQTHMHAEVRREVSC